MKIRDYDMIVAKSYEIANECAKQLNFEILDCDYVFESGVYILRIIAESETGLTIDEATSLNELISAKLDEYDYIKDEYYLEVSSAGLERPLNTDSDITSAVGDYINCRFFEKLDGKKELEGDLISYEDGILTLECNVKGVKKEYKIERKKIAKLRLAVKF